MALPYISSAWKTAQKTQFPPKRRFHIDFRGQDYPPLTGHNLAYRNVTPGDNQPGSHVAQVFAAGTNLVTSPEDLTAVGWADSNTTRALSSYYYRGKRLTTITASAALGYIYQDLAFTGNGVKAIQLILRQGTDSEQTILLRDETASAWRLNVSVNWAAETVIAGTGTVWFTEWISTTSGAKIVWIAMTTSTVTAANTNRLRLRITDNGATFHVTAVMAENSAYPTPYTATTRAAAAPQYVLPMASSWSMRLKVRPWFNYNSSAEYLLFTWWGAAANSLLYLEYDPSVDKLRLGWRDAGTVRYLLSSQCDDGTSYTDINSWLILDIAFNPAGGQTGSAFYVNRVLKSANWGGVPDSKASSFPLLNLGWYTAANPLPLDGEFAYLWYCPNKVITQADVTNDWADVKDEVIAWGFNGEGVGRTRCNVTNRVLAHSFEDPPGPTAARLSLELNNNSGCFSDDQYAAFDAADEVYNGTSSQKYMQNRCRLYAETWYGNDFEPFFDGRLTPDCFSRATTYDRQSRVSVTAEDRIAEIAESVADTARVYEDYYLSSPSSELSSALHAITRIATKPDRRNHIGDSSFDSPTPADSWYATTQANLTRQSGGLIGSYVGQYVYDAGTGGTQVAAQQTVTFLGDQKLNVGDTYTFSIWLKSAGTCGNNITLAESDSGGVNDSTSAAYAITGGKGWTRYSVSHTVTDAASDRLVVTVSLDDNVTLILDAADMIQDREPLNWYFRNSATGTSAVVSADDYATDSYDSLGFDVDDVLYQSDGATALQHPWGVVEYAGSPWEHLSSIGDATAVRVLCHSRSGALKFRCRLATGYEDPPSLDTVTSNVAEVRTSLRPQSANKWIVHGVKIKEDSYPRLLWTLDAVDVFDKDAGGYTAEYIDDGDSFPDATTYGVLWAKYAELTSLNFWNDKPTV